MTNQSTTQIAQRLLADGAITDNQYQGAMLHLEKHGGFFEEALLEIGVFDEETLLQHLARIFRTRYVTTEKLKRADIPRNILEMVPVKLAKKHNIFPILHDATTHELSIVSSDPSNIEIEQDIARISGSSRVRSFIARPAAIKAAIAKFYRGDIHAFANIDRESYRAFQSMMNVYERNLLDEGSMAAALANSDKSQERMISAEQMERGAARASSPFGQQLEHHLSTLVEMLKVMISLLESSRGELAGHSILVARHAERMCQRIDLPELETESITIAALLHDLSKGSPYHLTPFNVAEWKGHKTTAEKRYLNPIRLIESVDLPESTLNTLQHMYEQFDGNGFPDGLRGKDIPLGARILALADTFADLTCNPRNPYRRTLSTEEAIQILKKAKQKVFDPNLVELFSAVVTGDDIKRQLLTGAQTVMIVDPDPEQCAILDLQLTSQGFKVVTEHGADEAIKYVYNESVNIVLCETDIEPFDGFEFKRRLNSDDRTKDIPFIYFTSRAGSNAVKQGFDLGAQDYLVKPMSMDVLVAKINKILRQSSSTTSSSGVSGSLKEMSLPDLVQILSHGRKSGQLKLNIDQQVGEIHFVDGEIYNALFEKLRGEEAFFRMLRHKDGRFELNSDFRAEQRVINMTSEMLLLEGLRRFDEDNR